MQDTDHFKLRIAGNPLLRISERERDRETEREQERLQSLYVDIIESVWEVREM